MFLPYESSSSHPYSRRHQGLDEDEFDGIKAALKAAFAAKVISWGVYYHHFHYSQRLPMLSPG